ncbi:MAG: UDP-N-acetylmuramate--L-alanine ligase [Actinobacteria bacterium]|nr:MAG: UDP-N-acetylmuramate--L-alanine ligase [Actinomycetota bacterium]
MINKKYYFIGIGGAGMSGIAKVLKEMGANVAGSDIKESRNTECLEEIGIKVLIGHKKSNVTNPDVVVISSAIPSDNCELKAAKEKNIQVIQRAKMLAEIAKTKKPIAIAGTHGKTTTTSMVAFILEKAGLNPTFFIGGELNDIGSNGKYGSGQYLVAETDESDGSLLFMNPMAMVITNIEADHLDYFGSFEKIKKLFMKFSTQLLPGGFIVAYKDHPNVSQLLDKTKQPYVSYGLSKDNDFWASNIKHKGLSSSFDVMEGKNKLGRITINIPGAHNVLNALAAIALCRKLKVDFIKIKQALLCFSGVKRRFQLLGEANKAYFYDDYAHHPTEIAATLQAASSAKKKRLVCVFQPHRFSRTKFLARDFADAFIEADLLVITDIYAAGEEPIPGVSSKLIVDQVLKNNGHTDLAYLPSLYDVKKYLEGAIKPHDMVITMGAGDIWTVGAEIVEKAKLI